MAKFMERYHLDGVDARDLESVRNIAYDLMGNGAMKAGMALSFADADKQLTVSYLSAIMQQNWIMINQLSRLNSNIEKLANK